MWFSSWFAKRQRPTPSGRGLGSPRKRPGCRPHLEHLEGRIVPSAAYQFTTIDDPKGPGTTAATGINNRGDVVGRYNDASGPQHGFLLSAGHYTTLDAPAAVITYANGINDGEQVVGTYVSGDPQHGFIQHGFLLSHGKYTTLDDPKAAGTTVAQGINDRGEVVGSYIDAGGTQHGFLLSGGHYTTLDDPKATGGIGFGTVATGINDRGQVVGYYVDADNAIHGFLLSGGHYTTLDAPNSLQFTLALGINDRGQIVGYYQDDTAGHGYLLSGGQYTTLDAPNTAGLSVAAGINDSGQIVGYYNDASGATHGFIATPAGACGADPAPGRATGQDGSTTPEFGGRVPVVAATAAPTGKNPGVLADEVFARFDDLFGPMAANSTSRGDEWDSFSFGRPELNGEVR